MSSDGILIVVGQPLGTDWKNATRFLVNRKQAAYINETAENVTPVVAIKISAEDPSCTFKLNPLANSIPNGDNFLKVLPVTRYGSGSNPVDFKPKEQLEWMTPEELNNFKWFKIKLSDLGISKDDFFFKSKEWIESKIKDRMDFGLRVFSEFITPSYSIPVSTGDDDVVNTELISFSPTYDAVENWNISFFFDRDLPEFTGCDVNNGKVFARGSEYKPYRYTVKTKTSNSHWAETNSNVWARMETCDGFVEDFSLNTALVDDHEQGDTRYYSYYLEEPIPLRSVKLMKDNSGSGGAGWELDEVEIEIMDLENNEPVQPLQKVTGPFNFSDDGVKKGDVDKNNDGHFYKLISFPNNQNSGCVEYYKNNSPSSNQGTYSIKIQTGIRKDAQTKADISLKICGEVNGIDGDVCINKTIQGASKGEEVVLSFDDIAFNKFKSAELSNNDNDGWYVEDMNITVTPEDASQGFSQSIPFRTWIDSDAGTTVTRKANKGKAFDFVLYTGDYDNASTNARVYARICDENDLCIDFNLDNPDINDREAGDDNRFLVFTEEDFGTPVSLTLYRDNSGSIGAGWFLDKVKIEESGFNNLPITSFFHYNQWISGVGVYEGYKTYSISSESFSFENGNSATMTSGVKSNRLANQGHLYDISVTTQDVTNAGTDAEVWLRAYGCNGEASFYLDYPSGGYDDRMRGATDQYLKVREVDLGEIYRIELLSDAADDDSWAVGDVRIKEFYLPSLEDGNTASLHSVLAPFDTWLGEEDGQNSGTIIFNNKDFYVRSWDKNLVCAETPVTLNRIKSGNGIVRSGKSIDIEGSNVGTSVTNWEALIDENKINVVLASGSGIRVDIPESVEPGIRTLSLIHIPSNTTTKFEVEIAGPAPIATAIGSSLKPSGSILMISGENFGQNWGIVDVKIGGVSAKLISLQDNLIKVIVPDLIDGDYSVETFVGSQKAEAIFNLEVTGMTPQIELVNPNRIEPGSILTLQGRNFGTKTLTTKVFVNNTEYSIESLANDYLTIEIPTNETLGYKTIKVIRNGRVSNEITFFVGIDWVRGQTYNSGEFVVFENKVCELTHHVGNQGWESIDPDDPNLWAVWNCREAVYPGSVENWVSRGIYYKGEVVRFENQYCEVLTNSTAGWSTIEPTHYSMHSVWSCRNMSLEPQVSGWVSGQEYMKGEQVDYNGKRCQMSYWSNSGWEHLPPDSPVLWAVWKCED